LLTRGRRYGRRLPASCPWSTHELQEQELGAATGKSSGSAQLPVGIPEGSESVGRTRAALTANDGPFLRDNHCPQDGVFSFCNPNHFHGFFAEANGTHSKFNIAPFSGGGAVNINFRLEGTTVGTFAAFMGEVHTIFGRSNRHSVRELQRDSERWAPSPSRTW
jgi:hypothetical protein